MRIEQGKVSSAEARPHAESAVGNLAEEQAGARIGFVSDPPALSIRTEAGGCWKMEAIA